MKNLEARPKRVCSPRYAIKKAERGVELSRWELEDLSKSPSYALEYAAFKDFRFFEAEKTFLDYLKNETGQYWTQSNIIDYFIKRLDKRNKCVEKFIKIKMWSSHQVPCAVEYSKNVIRGRWMELEKIILKNGDCNDICEYQTKVVGGRWKELEELIFNNKKCEFNKKEVWAKYTKSLGASAELEAVMEKSEKASLLLAYATSCLKGPLPKTLHQKMMMFSFVSKKKKTIKKYLRFVKDCKERAKAYLASLDEDEKKEFLLN